MRCTLRPPEPPRGHGIGVPAASAPLCVSDRLGGMPHCGRLRDGPLRPPLPRRYDETVAGGSAADEHLIAGQQARERWCGGDCGSFHDGAAAVACGGDRTVGGPLAGRAAGVRTRALRVWWRGCPACTAGGARHAGVHVRGVLWLCVRAHARDGSGGSCGATC